MMSLSMRKVRLSQLICFFGVISFFRPTIFEKFEISNAIFNGMLIISFTLCTIDYLRRNRIDRDFFFWVCLAFYGVMAYSTITNYGSISRMLMFVLVSFTSTIFAQYIIKYEFEYTTRLVRSLAWLFIIINIITIIVFPDGIVQTGRSDAAVWFLGQSTRFSNFYLPALLFCYLSDEYKQERISRNTIALYFICLSTLIIKWSVGSAVSMLFLLVFFIFHHWKVFNWVVYYCTQIGAYVGITYFSIQELFAALITGFLKKDMTLSSRTLLWRIGLNEISKSPLLGIGVQDNNSMQSLMGFVHLHSHLLNLTLQTGYLGLSLFLIVLLVSYIRLGKHLDFYPSKVISVFLFMIGIQLLFDTVDGVRNHYIFLISIGAAITELNKVFMEKEASKN